MKEKIENVKVFWNENKTKFAQVAVVGIVGGFAIKTSFKLGRYVGTAGTLSFIEENIPEAFALVKGYFNTTVL